MTQYNAFYAQSGGPTAVINASACGVIETARQLQANIGTVFAGRYGILGALQENLLDTSLLTAESITKLMHTPGAAFGSCRYQLSPQNSALYERILAVFKAHHIRYFFYNGGGDSQDTVHKLAAWSEQKGYPLTCIGIPKTIDNDLPITDNSPGFGSVAKYIAVSIQEASLDLAAMCHSSTQVFLLEVMGRHSGWIAAAGGLAARAQGDAPHIILFPELSFHPKTFLERVHQTVQKFGFCSIVASEGIRDTQGNFLSDTNAQDAFGHQQLGGLAPRLAQLIRTELQFKTRYAVADYLQRAARHIASKVDVEQAYALGKAAVEMALENKNSKMPTLIRKNTDPYQWIIGEAPIEHAANQEQTLPLEFITPDGFHITPACRRYLLPLIQGEAYPPYKEGLPDYFNLNPLLEHITVPRKLPDTNFLPADA